MNAASVATFTDLEGAAFSVWQAKEHKGARIVNQPGSLNLNALNARDTETGESFYGAVFGWGTGRVGRRRDGLDARRLWRLREAERSRVAPEDGETGVPAGFDDVVAMPVPIADDQPHVPAHWGVTFAVDDADATAERAARLGSRAIVPPFDAPFVRMAVISDPQGATFTASKFVPHKRTR